MTENKQIKRQAVPVDGPLVARLQRIKESEGRTITAMVRLALIDWLDRHEERSGVQE